MTAPKSPLINRRTLLTRSATTAALLALLETHGLSASPAASPEAPHDAVSRLAAGNLTFAFDLYHTLRTSSDANILFSPFSLSFALAMVYAGASDETASQMTSALSLPDDSDTASAAFHTLSSDLAQRGNTKGDHGASHLTITDALWCDQSFAFGDAFLTTLEDDFDAEIRPTDFLSDPDSAQDEINDWVADQTNDTIEGIIPDDVINDETRLLLANAIYFSSGWKTPFDKGNTGTDTFHLADGTSVETSFLTQDMTLAYAETDRAQVIELPYTAEGFGLVIILPDTGHFDAVEESLDRETWQEMIGMLKSSDVRLSLPAFEFDIAESLVPALKSLGMTNAFDKDQADFSGMTNEGDESDGLVISNVLHKTLMSVDQHGTLAAEASTVDGNSSPTPTADTPVTMRVDRPFLFAIRDGETKTLLFLGRLLDPTGPGGAASSSS